MAANSMRRKPKPTKIEVSASNESAAAKAARDKLRGVNNVDTGENFDKAWERVYGSKEYRPSWVGKIDDKGGRRMLPPPTKAYQSKPKPIKEITSQTDLRKGIPDHHRATSLPAPLTIGGRVLPKEKELTKWKQDIETDEVDAEGNPVYNKVVKKINVKGWINNNSYWQPQDGKVIIPPKPKKRQPIPAPKNQVIHKSKYDLVGKFEDKVQNPDLKLGAEEIPKEPELKKWGDDLEIPDNALEEDYTASLGPKPSKKLPGRKNEGRRLATRLSHPQPTGKNNKWNDVLKTADVPSFFTKNTFWES